VEIGSQNINGSLRKNAPPGATYLGLDLEAGPGVDAVIAQGAPLPLATASADLVVASSVLEHDPKFWLSFLELCRITKKGGFIYLNIPSNGRVHRYPVDCWRFYPDAANALTDWATSNSLQLHLVESFTAKRRLDMWNDFVAVYERGNLVPRSPTSMLSSYFVGWNVYKFDSPEIGSARDSTEDMWLLKLAAGALVKLALLAQTQTAADGSNDAVGELLASPKLRLVSRLVGRRMNSQSAEKTVLNIPLGPFEPLYEIVSAALEQPPGARDK
jgi:SAM-dependent methyltransferase